MCGIFSRSVCDNLRSLFGSLSGAAFLFVALPRVCEVDLTPKLAFEGSVVSSVASPSAAPRL